MYSSSEKNVLLIVEGAKQRLNDVWHKAVMRGLGIRLF